MSTAEPSPRPSSSSGGFGPSSTSLQRQAASQATASGQATTTTTTTTLASRPPSLPDAARTKQQHHPSPALVPAPGSILLVLPPPTTFIEAAIEQWGEGEFPGDRRLNAEDFAAVTAAASAVAGQEERQQGKQVSSSPLPTTKTQGSPRLEESDRQVENGGRHIDSGQTGAGGASRSEEELAAQGLQPEAEAGPSSGPSPSRSPQQQQQDRQEEASAPPPLSALSALPNNEQEANISRKRKSMEVDDDDDGQVRGQDASRGGFRADVTATTATMESQPMDRSFADPKPEEGAKDHSSKSADTAAADVSMEDGEIEDDETGTAQTGPQDADMIATAGPTAATDASSMRASPAADVAMSTGVAEPKASSPPKPDALHHQQPSQIVGKNGLPILTRQHYHPKVIALARKLAAQRGMKLVVDEELVERMRHREPSSRQEEEDGGKRLKLESSGDGATNDVVNVDGAQGSDSNSRALPAATRDAETPISPANALQQRLKSELNGGLGAESTLDSPMVSAPTTPALPLTNKLLFGATGGGGSVTASPSLHSTPAPASPRIGGGGNSHKKKGGKKDNKSHNKAKVHIVDHQSASALERERDERERAALPPGMSIALDGTLKNTEEVMYERKARDVSKGIGSTSWWNHLLIDARKQRGPQWDINTNMYQVDRLSAFYYQSTAPPPRTPSPQPESQPLPDPSVHSVQATPADRPVPLPGAPSGQQDTHAPAPIDQQRRQSFVHGMSPFYQATPPGPGPGQSMRRPSVVMPNMMGQAGSPGRPIDAPSPHGTIAASQASPHSVSAAPATAGSPYGQPPSALPSNSNMMAGLPPAIAASLTPQQVQQVMRNQQQRNMQAALAAAAATGQGQSPNALQAQYQQQQQQQQYAGSPPASGASPSSAGQVPMTPNGAGGQAQPHAEMTPQQIQQQAILRQYAMAQSNAFGNGGRPGGSAGMQQAPGQPNAALVAMLAQAQQIGGPVDARIVQALQARLAAQQQQQQQQQSPGGYGISPTGGFNPGNLQGGVGMNPNQLMMFAASQQAQQQQQQQQR